MFFNTTDCTSITTWPLPPCGDQGVCRFNSTGDNIFACECFDGFIDYSIFYGRSHQICFYAEGLLQNFAAVALVFSCLTLVSVLYQFISNKSYTGLDDHFHRHVFAAVLYNIVVTLFFVLTVLKVYIIDSWWVLLIVGLYSTIFAFANTELVYWMMTLLDKKMVYGKESFAVTCQAFTMKFTMGGASFILVFALAVIQIVYTSEPDKYAATSIFRLSLLRVVSLINIFIYGSFYLTIGYFSNKIIVLLRKNAGQNEKTKERIKKFKRLRVIPPIMGSIIVGLEIFIMLLPAYYDLIRIIILSVTLMTLQGQIRGLLMKPKKSSTSSSKM